MKYMILAYGSQRDYDAMAGKSAEHPGLTPEDFAPMYAFMESFNNDLAESGELVDTRGLDAPVHTRRVHLRAWPRTIGATFSGYWRRVTARHIGDAPELGDRSTIGVVFSDARGGATVRHLSDASAQHPRADSGGMSVEKDEQRRGARRPAA